MTLERLFSQNLKIWCFNSTRKKSIHWTFDLEVPTVLTVTFVLNFLFQKENDSILWTSLIKKFMWKKINFYLQFFFIFLQVVFQIFHPVWILQPCMRAARKKRTNIMGGCWGLQGERRIERFSHKFYTDFSPRLLAVCPSRIKPLIKSLDKIRKTKIQWRLRLNKKKLKDHKYQKAC